jgi:hypothetical protein
VAVAARVDEFGPNARTALRLAIRRDRAAGLCEMRDKLIMGSVEARLGWINACRAIGAAPDMERDLCDIAEALMDADPAPAQGALAVAATAVAALSDCSGERSANVLARALHATDARVAANAVEAISRRARRSASMHKQIGGLIEFKDAAAHRVRANAALALLRFAAGGERNERTGAGILDQMLADGRPPHRLAGLWLADRAVTGGAIAPDMLVEPVARLLDDADDDVRDRADRCRRRLGILAGLREVMA